MKIADLGTFQNAPFLLWVKDEQWRYLWGNRGICGPAGEDVFGKRRTAAGLRVAMTTVVKTCQYSKGYPDETFMRSD